MTLLSDINFGLGLLSSFGQQVDVVGIYANGADTNNPTAAVNSTILNSILGTSNAPAFGQLFANARPMKATVRETSKVMEHPVETGSMIADHHIINPVEIDLPLIISSQYYAATYNQIRQAFVNATALSVKTRVGIYSDMIVADMPHEEEADMYDVITINLRLKQVLYVVPGGGQLVNFQPADPLNSNTLAGGLQQAAALGTQASNAVGAALSYVKLGKFL
ncbi:phage baseplate protein [Fimbriiglobus ruber]|uniref:Phage protein n=1 Tax=Fimbriiglobus ruber TaxID=1908690 RepID=A0A225DKG9_9BACT|nr:hypothetical protein [Fimbriiglobus ruber]OWK36895.1 Phage protein [Fimbriiglobus ruber]